MKKTFKLIYNIIYYIIFAALIGIIILAAVQKYTDNKKAIAGYRMYNIVTKSMEPEYKVGDVILSKEIEPAKLKVGDDIVYEGKKDSYRGLVVTHRIIEKDEINNEKNNAKYKFITKGIANELADPEITDDQIYGKVEYKVKSLSLVSKLMNNKIAFFVIFIILIILISLKLVTRRREDEEFDEEELDQDEDEDEDEEIEEE